MHEYSVTTNILDIAITEAKKANAHKITAIKLVIGDLSSIIDNSVQFYFGIASKDTIAEGAELIFRRIKAKIGCSQCGLVSERPEYGFQCPHCGGDGVLTEEGSEFYIEGILVQ